MSRRRPAWRVVRAVEAELRRQVRDGTLGHASPMEDDSCVFVTGTIDLAALADVTERALRDEFRL